jgi:hypothetical protein
MKKKINIDRDPINGGEITSRMNFNQLLSNFPGYIKLPFYKTGWFITTVASVAVLVTVTTILFSNNNAKDGVISASPPVTTESIITYAEDTPCINPPIKKLDIQSDSYYCENEVGGEFTHSSGSLIKVPKNTFVDKNGNSLNGEIELRYREFHDPIDFILSGIPMTYDSAETEYTFESAGMIEIYGYQNGKPIEIAVGKSIRIEMNPKDGSSRFNLYELDTSSGDWGYKGKTELVSEDMDESIGAPSVTSKTSKDDVISNIMKTKEAIEVTKTEIAIAKKEVIEHKKTQPSKPKASVNKDRQFDLDVDPKEFPELKNYSSLTFEVDKNDRNFSADVYDIEWEDISLSEKEKGKSYYLTLFKGSAKKTFSVFPIFEGTDYEKAMVEFNQNFSTYEKELDKRISNEKKIQEKYEKQMKLYESELALEKKRQADFEKNQATYFAQVKQAQKNIVGISIVARAFEVTQFGTWNCDSPVSKPSGAKVNASFADNAGVNLGLHNVNLIEKNKNAVFTYGESQFNNFKFNPKEENTIVAFTANNEIAIIKPIYFKDMPKEKKHQFEMEIIDVKSMTVKNVKEKLNL